MNKTFIKGLDLNHKFYRQVIQPLLEERFPAVRYSAALLGYGSDVLGYDTPTSIDHNWGPRCVLFLHEEDFHLAEDLRVFFSHNLPLSFLGFPTNFSNPRDDHTQTMLATGAYPINHLIEILPFEAYFKNQLRVNNIQSISKQEWLNLNDQVLLELTRGAVFHDGLNWLEAMRNALKFYPEDIRRLRLASLWQSVSNEEAFIGRCIQLNDEIGLKLIAARMVNTLMKIAFYYEQRYIPYSKWFGTAFKDLVNGGELQPLIQAILDERNPADIEAQLCALGMKLVEIHNRDADLPHLDNKVENFFGRPSKVIFAERIVAALIDSIQDAEIQKCPLNTTAIDVKLDSVDWTD